MVERLHKYKNGQKRSDETDSEYMKAIKMHDDDYTNNVPESIIRLHVVCWTLYPIPLFTSRTSLNVNERARVTRASAKVMPTNKNCKHLKP